MIKPYRSILQMLAALALAATPVAFGATAEDAAETYKEVRTLQFDGAPETEVYEKAYQAVTEAIGALAADSVSDEDADQCKGILIDLNPIMAKASVHHSINNDSQGMTRFARAYVDTQLLPQMAGVDFRRDAELYPALVYVAASGSYNSGDIENAIRYFEEYLSTEDKKNREAVSLFYGQAILQTGQQQRGVAAMVKAADEYPANYQILTIAMQLCLDTSDRQSLYPLVERALTLKPNDERLLNLQAQGFEDNQNYRAALDVYMRLDEMHPNSLNINESIARCYYNLGTSHYNESITAATEKDAARSRRQSNAYFSTAAEKYEELADNDPNNEKYLKAMASAYATLGNKSKVDAVNVRLTALGASPVAMNDLPSIIGDPQAPGRGASPRNIPSYQEYARAYVTGEMKKWAQRGEFEKVDDYTRRMAPENIRKEQERLSAVTEERYLKEYAGHLVLSELTLQPYDVENETYAVNSDFGPVYIKVPLKNKEAEMFKSQWEKVQIRNAKFFILNDNIAISNITFRTPAGKEYTYNSNALLAYAPPVVEVDPTLFMADNTRSESNRPEAEGSKVTVVTVESDVDKDIPVNKQNNTSTIALVIANENYGKVSDVASARHDGEIFARYCRETLGIPDRQVIYVNDATFGNMLSAISQLKNSVKALGDGTDVIFYYAGHGVPDENSKEAYLLPVDADPMVMATAYPLSQLYQELSGMGAENVMVFMDACFSGANRGEGMLAAARGVVLKAAPTAPKGSMYVLSAADGNQTALPWKEKNHGLFTYYLLKKLQQTKGNATLADLAEYVKSEVEKTASLTLNKPQTPTLNVTGAVAGEINKKRLRR